MNKLQPGQRIKLAGGYDMIPRWLNHGDGYFATVIRFLDNRIRRRRGDERLSAVIEFDEPIEFEGLTAKHGVLLGRWEGQQWEETGIVHVQLVEHEISDASELSQTNSRNMESHARYRTVSS